MVDITQNIFQYLEAKRHLWNIYFINKVNSLRDCSPLDEYEEIDVILQESYLKEALNFVQKSIIQEAMKNPGTVFTASEVATEYDISVNTARTYMNKLVEYKVLSPYKKGKTKAYIAPANLHEIIKSR